MDRRNFLQGSIIGSASSSLTRMVARAGLLSAPSGGVLAASSATVPVESLRKALSPQDATILTPSDSAYAAYQFYAAANKRVARSPAARVLLRTNEGAAAAVNWLRNNRVPFAVRGGGHCYEAFSQNVAVVLDLRNMADVKVEDGGATVSVGGGALLGQIYQALTEIGRIVPAGSCPQVGVAGHVLGGGFGLFSRKYGLTCDSLTGVEIVDAKGRILSVNDKQESDLFWALRGGGAGAFGVVTRLIFKTRQIDSGTRFTIDWGEESKLALPHAAAAFQAWQEWAPKAPREITPILRVSGGGQVRLHCFGISTRTDEAWVRQQVEPLARQTGGSLGPIVTQPTVDLLKHFGGSHNRLTGTLNDREFFDPTYFKGKSDVIASQLDTASVTALLAAVADAGLTDVICDAYGGAVADLADDATAFVHRSKTLFNMQYIVDWTSSSEAEQRRRLDSINRVYAALSHARTGAAYFNYCDLDIGPKNFASAYWGSNVPRLRHVKAIYDPTNLFHHPQSVTPA